MINNLSIQFQKPYPKGEDYNGQEVEIVAMGYKDDMAQFDGLGFLEDILDEVDPSVERDKVLLIAVDNPNWENEIEKAKTLLYLFGSEGVTFKDTNYI